MNQLSALGLDNLATFFSDEDIVAKADALELTEGQFPYQQLPPLGHDPFWKRVLRAASAVPEEHRLGLIALACNAICITSRFRDDLLRNLATKLTDRIASMGSTPRDVQLFALDHPGLLDDLFRVGAHRGWLARIDHTSTTGLRTVRELLAALEALPNSTDIENGIAARAVFERPIWLFLADNVLSGTSASSDLARAAELVHTFCGDRQRPHILLCAEIITQTALDQKLADIQDQIIYGVLFDNRFRVAHDDCRLFNSPETLTRVRAFCSWFAQIHFPEEDPQLSLLFAEADVPPTTAFDRSLQAHRDAGGITDFRYGWADLGMTLVLDRNCPNNSVPALWFPCVGPLFSKASSVAYVPPFPRAASRLEYARSKTAELFGRVMAASQAISEALRARP